MYFEVYELKGDEIWGHTLKTMEYWDNVRVTDFWDKRLSTGQHETCVWRDQEFNWNIRRCLLHKTGVLQRA